MNGSASGIGYLRFTRLQPQRTSESRASDLVRIDDQFGVLLGWLYDGVKEPMPPSDLDWARVMLLTEINWASSLLGAGADFDTITGIIDDEGIQLLRAQ